MEEHHMEPPMGVTHLLETTTQILIALPIRKRILVVVETTEVLTPIKIPITVIMGTVIRILIQLLSILMSTMTTFQVTVNRHGLTEAILTAIHRHLEELLTVNLIPVDPHIIAMIQMTLTLQLPFQVMLFPKLIRIRSMIYFIKELMLE